MYDAEIFSEGPKAGLIPAPARVPDIRGAHESACQVAS